MCWLSATEITSVTREAMIELFTQGKALMTINYMATRSPDGWIVFGHHREAVPHTVNSNFTECSCPDFKYRKKGLMKTCKHIEELRICLGNVSPPVENPSPTK